MSESVKKKSNRQKHQEYVDFVKDVLLGLGTGKYKIVESTQEYWDNFRLDYARKYLIDSGREKYTYHMEVEGNRVICVPLEGFPEIILDINIEDEQ